MSQPFLSVADGWGGSAVRSRRLVGQHGGMREQGPMVPPDGQFRRRRANSLQSHSPTSAPPRVCKSLLGRSGRDLSGEPRAPSIHGIWNPCREARVVSWFQNSAGRAMSLEGNRAPSVRGQAQHRSPLRLLSPGIRPRIAGRCDGSRPLRAAHPSMSVSRVTPLQPGLSPPCPPPTSLHAPPEGSLR